MLQVKTAAMEEFEVKFYISQMGKLKFTPSHHSSLPESVLITGIKLGNRF